MDSTHGHDASISTESRFLPDFCSVRMVFSVIVLGELLAFILALGPSVSADSRWRDLALISLFVQWVALSNCAILCVLRRYIERTSVAQVSMICLLVVVTVTLLVSECGYMISRHETFSLLLPSGWHGEFLLRNAAVSAIITLAALRLFYLQNRLRLSIESRSRARFHALQARIRPHFLFNSMNTIASLTRSQPQLAETIVEDLADLFRVTLSAQDDQVTLTDELQLCRRYLNIEQTRLGERLKVDWQFDNMPPDFRVPSLFMQPLLENAIYHGVEPSPTGGTVRIEVRDDGRFVHILIENPLDPASGQKRHGHQIALQNVRDRLDDFYAGHAVLTTQQDENRFQVHILLPRCGEHYALADM